MDAGRSYRLFLGLGTNLGDRKANLEYALRRLNDSFGQHWAALSDFIETEPWGFSSPDNFLNAVVEYDVVVRPGITDSQYLHGVLEHCKRIEREMGRTEGTEYDGAGRRLYSSRIIDIDILMMGDVSIRDATLTVPHPLMREREFVMRPLRQIYHEEPDKLL